MERGGIFAMDLREMGPSTRNDIPVSVSNLFKRYKNGTEATRGIDMSIESGECVAILGPNGAGKTTFLRQITTELKPTSGTIEIFGIDAINEPYKAKQVMGVTPQDAGVFDTLTVRQHLELFGKLKGLDARSSRIHAGELIEGLELTNESGKRVGELSGGQRRRILIGLALLGRPPLLILDEPTTGLDPISRRTVWALLKDIVAGGTTVVLSSHYLEEAEHLCHRIAFIDEGKIAAVGSLPELRAGHPNKYRLSYLNGNEALPVPRVEFFADFETARRFIGEKQIDEYQLATASLEDVYFSLIGKRLSNGEDDH